MQNVCGHARRGIALECCIEAGEERCTREWLADWHRRKRRAAGTSDRLLGEEKCYWKRMADSSGEELKWLIAYLGSIGENDWLTDRLREKKNCWWKLSIDASKLSHICNDFLTVKTRGCSLTNWLTDRLTGGSSPEEWDYIVNQWQYSAREEHVALLFCLRQWMLMDIITCW